MILLKKHIRHLGLAAALVLGITVAGCTVHAGYRVYDPYYGDYHVWDGPEPGYYNEWIIETHRPYREFRRLRPEERREYFSWRHAHTLSLSIADNCHIEQT